MKTLDQLIKEQLALPPVLPEARAVLGTIPGVLGVGVGFRTRGGRLTEEIVLRVYVRDKRPRAELPESACIPPVFGGVPTDVTLPLEMRSIEVKPEVEPKGLNRKVSTLVGGLLITDRENFEGEAWGTLGCFATLKTDPSVKVLLTNHHVLYDNPADTGEGLLVGQPEITCSWCCKSGVIGRTMNGIVDKLVDCAIARLNNKRPAVQKLPGVGKDAHGQNEDLITGVPQPVSIPIAGVPTSVLTGEPVRKVGRSTGPTSGKVIEHSATITLRKGTPDEDIMNEQIIIFVEKGADLRGDGVMYFATGGDSGAVLINRFNQVVGLVHKEAQPQKGEKEQDVAGLAAACQIHHVLDKLQIDIITSPGAATTRTPAQPVPFTPPPPTPSPTPTGALLPGATLITHRITKEERERAVVLDEIVSLLERNAGGAEILRLYDAHHVEIRQLVNHDRKVKIIWHRSSGPAFVARLLGGMRDLSQPIPKEVNGMSVEQAIRRMAEAFSERGSASLAAAVNDYLTLVLDLVRQSATVAELLANVEACGGVR